MLEKLIGGLIPGMRDLRAPMIGGLVWFVDLTLVIRAVGLTWPSDMEFTVGTLIGFLGPGPTIALGAVGIFIVGVTGATVTNLASAMALPVIRRIRRQIRWQTHLFGAPAALAATQEELGRLIEGLDRQLEQLDADSPQFAAAADQLAKLDRERKGVSAAIVELEPLNRIWYAIKHRAPSDLTAATRVVVGDGPKSAHDGLEQDIAAEVWSEGIIDALAGAEHALDPGTALIWIEHARTDDFGNKFAAEMARSDPLDVIRPLDARLYDQLDRERAEREVRREFGFPLSLLMILLSLQVSAPFLALGAVLPFWVFLVATGRSDAEFTRVLNLIRLNKLRTPALEATYVLGRQRLLQVIEEEKLRREHQYAASSRSVIIRD